MAVGECVLQFFSIEEFMPTRYIEWATGAIDDFAPDLDENQLVYFRDEMDQAATEQYLEAVRGNLRLFLKLSL
jgi:hypothetical protein